MLIDIINGISVKLNNVFGDGYEIYTENVKQGLNEPCFFIKPLKTLNKPFLKNRKQRTYPFDIVYLTNGENSEMEEVMEKAIDELEYITLFNGDILRASDISGEIIDDVLHISLTYKVMLNTVEEKEFMEHMAAKTTIKEEFYV